MAFLETQFPTDISYRSKGGPEYNTSVAGRLSGREVRNANWTYPRHNYDAAYGVRTHANLETLIAFFHVVQGRYQSFRYKDFADYKSSVGKVAIADTDQTIGTGDGSTLTFQLTKTYTAGASTKTRIIAKPVSGTTIISVNDISQGSGWTVDTTTGIVTFTTAPGNTLVVKAGYEFDVPCRLVSDSMETSFDAYDCGSASFKIKETRLT